MIKQPASETCEFCGEPLVLDLFEVWGREFMIETCCEGLHEAAADELQGGSRDPWIRELFEAYGIPCRQICADEDFGGTFQIDHGLTLAEVDFRTACDFIAEHHEHHKPSRGWRWGHAIYNGIDLIGVCMVGRPVARAINGAEVVEVTRLCVRRDLPRGLEWNACSMLYGAAAKEAKRRGFKRIITYILETEEGTTLKAVGWEREARTKGGSWNSPGRRRIDKAPTCRKWRYARPLVA